MGRQADRRTESYDTVQPGSLYDMKFSNNILVVYPEMGGSIFFRNVGTTCQTARCYTPEDCNMNLHRNKNFKSQIRTVFILEGMHESCWEFFL
jgi:hypothetical protein